MARSKSSSALYRKILDALKEGPLSTVDLAGRLKEDPPKIYRYCSHLKKLRLVSSHKEQGKKRVLFCKDDKEAVTQQNYDDHEGHNLGSFNPQVQVWQLVKPTAKGRQLSLEL